MVWSKLNLKSKVLLSKPKNANIFPKLPSKTSLTIWSIENGKSENMRNRNNIEMLVLLINKWSKTYIW